MQVKCRKLKSSFRDNRRHIIFCENCRHYAGITDGHCICCFGRVRLYKKNNRWLASTLNLVARQYKKQVEEFLLFPEANISIIIKRKEITYKIPIKIIALWAQNLPRQRILAYAHDNITTL